MSWKIFLLLISLGLSACSSGPIWKPKIYLTDPDDVSIKRAGEVIRADSTKFKYFVCLPQKDLETLYNKCVENKPWWKNLY